MWAPALFFWVVSTAGYLLWDPIVGFFAVLFEPLVLALALWPAWLGAIWITAGLRTPRWLERMQVVPRSVAWAVAWLWAVGWTFAMPNPMEILALEVAPAARDLPGMALLRGFTNWAMDHPRNAFPLFLLTGWCVGALWSLRSDEQGNLGTKRRPPSNSGA